MSDWPYPARPGIPLNPERDGPHWLEDTVDGVGTGHIEAVYYAAWSVPTWYRAGNRSPIKNPENWIYLGPVLTPAAAAALQARVAELEGALKAYPRFTEILMTSQQKRIFILEAALADMIAVATECAGLAGQALNSKYLEKIQNAEKIIVKFVSGGKDE